EARRNRRSLRLHHPRQTPKRPERETDSGDEAVELMPRPKDAIDRVAAEIIACSRCPRLVAWREEAAADPPARYLGEEYWARAVPGFGDRNARLLLVGLAPAAHGGNRTGRVFTGDRS